MQVLGHFKGGFAHIQSLYRSGFFGVTRTTFEAAEWCRVVAWFLEFLEHLCFGGRALNSVTVTVVWKLQGSTYELGDMSCLFWAVAESLISLKRQRKNSHFYSMSIQRLLISTNVFQVTWQQDFQIWFFWNSDFKIIGRYSRYSNDYQSFEQNGLVDGF